MQRMQVISKRMEMGKRKTAAHALPKSLEDYMHCCRLGRSHLQIPWRISFDKYIARHGMTLNFQGCEEDLHICSGQKGLRNNTLKQQGSRHCRIFLRRAIHLQGGLDPDSLFSYLDARAVLDKLRRAAVASRTVNDLQRSTGSGKKSGAARVDRVIENCKRPR